MEIVDCRCAPEMAERFHSNDAYRTPRYTFIGREQNTLNIRVYTGLPGGMRFEGGSAEVKKGALLLTCRTVGDAADAGTPVPWELTFAVTSRSPFAPGSYYFMGKLMDVARF